MCYITNNIECFIENWCELQGDTLTMCIDGNDSDLAIDLAVKEQNGDYKYDIIAHDIDRNEGGIGTLTIEFDEDLLKHYHNKRMAIWSAEKQAQHDEYRQAAGL